MADNVISKIELPDGSQYSIKDAGAARSNHTHTTTLAEDSAGTSSISLKAGTKYKLTSGGTPYTFTTPADTNDKVTQTATTTSANYEILFSETADNTNRTEGARKTSTLTYNPSTKDLSTGGKVNGYTLAAASARSVDETIGASSTSTNLPTSKAVATFVEGKGYVTSSGVTQVGTGAGLTGGTITGTGTIKANLTSETKLTNAAADGTETAGRVYPVRLDKDGKLAVNVPWTNVNGSYLTSITTTGNGNAITAVEKSGQSITFTKGSTFLTSVPNSFLEWQTTTSASTDLYDFGVYVNKNNAASSSMNGGNYFSILNIPYSKASGNTKAYWGWQIGNTTSNDGRLWYRTTGDNVWGDWQTIAHATQSTSNIGSTTQPVYMTAAGVITAGTPLKNLAYKDSLLTADIPELAASKITSGTFDTARIPNLAWSKITSGKPTTLSGYGITDAKIASGVITLGSNTITPVTSVNGHTGNVVNVTAADLGLASALKYVGSVSSLPAATNATTYSTYNNGDVITVNYKEYAYVKGTSASNSSWTELGDEGSYKTKQTAVTSATAETDTATTFVYSVTQNANGVIDVTTRPLPSYSASSHNHDSRYLKLDGSNNMTADVNIIAGDTDKFVNFWYNTNKTAGASWRIGELGNGSGEANYFVIQSGTSNSSATAWNNALRIGANTFGVYLPSTTASTSRDSGALVVSGGAGIGGQVTALRLAANGSSTSYNLYVNGLSYLNGNTYGKGYVLFNSNAVDCGSFLAETRGTAPTATTTDGTTTYSGAVIGTSVLTLGNNKIGANTASGVNDNAKGYLRIYGANSGYGELNYNDAMFASNKSIYLYASTNSGISNEIRGLIATNDYWRVAGGATESNAGYMEIATADDSNEPIYVRQYSGVFTTLKRTATLLDASGNTEFPGTVTALKFIGALQGNADTATNATNHIARTDNPHSVTASQLGLGNVENTKLSTWKGSTNITTLGTITSGTWNGTAIANNKLANSSLTVGNKSISLGGSGTVHDILKTSTSIGADTSWDQYDPGVYYVASSTAFTGTNNPENANTNNGIAPYTYGQLIVSRAGTGGVAQFYIAHNDSNSASYGIHYRTGWNNTYVAKWSVLIDSHNYTNYAVAKTAGVTAVTWDSTNNKLTRTINGTTSDVVTLATIKTALGTMTPSSHAHGNITNGGTITSTAAALANGDNLLFADSSNSGKIERSSITIGTATNTWLCNNGTWTTPTAAQVGAATSGHTHATTIAEAASGDTNSLTLAFNKKYKLTTGGTNFIFTTPANPNTDTKVNVTARGTTKAYLLATSTSPTTSAQGVTALAETGVYLDTTAGKLVATTFVGALTGNVTGNVTGSSGSCTGNAATATSATKLSNTTAIGSNVRPVYFTNGGIPQATATEMIRAFTTTSAGTDLDTYYDSGMYSITGGDATNYPTGGSEYATLLTVAYRKPSGNTKPDYAWQMGNFTQNNDRLWYRTSSANAWRAWRQIVNIATNTAVGNGTTPIYVTADGEVKACTAYANASVANASKISAKLATTTKTFLLGTSTTITNTATNVDLIGDTGVYVTTTAGEFSAVRHSYNVAGVERAYTHYNMTDQSIDFIFV